MDLLTVNETYFFREQNQLKAFSEEILEELKTLNRDRKTLRVWSAGCSTGEEPYTIAMLINERGHFNGWDIEIHGSDINQRVLQIARSGVYRKNSFRTTEPYFMTKYFSEDNGSFKISDAAKKHVNFSYLNLLDPFKSKFLGKMDVIFCRNVLIYFDNASRRRVIENFHDRLVDGGYLLLGHAESLINISTAFTLKHLKNDMVYQKPNGNTGNQMKTKVLIVDDSAYTRQTMKKIIEEDNALEVVGIATDGIDAMAKALRLQPDIITLDFEMPGMDGFSFLRWLMRERPTPVIMVTSHADSKTVFKALELGAVDFIAKPTRRASIELQTIEKDLLKKIKGLKKIRLDILSKNLELLDQEEEEIVETRKSKTSRHAVEIVAVGSSTGGPAALQIILTRLPSDFKAAMVISQHMPKGFTAPLAERLDRMSQIKIKEAAEGDDHRDRDSLYLPRRPAPRPEKAGEQETDSAQGWQI